MKTKSIRLTLALLTIAGANAQPDQAPQGHRPAPPLIAVLDTDHDGIISAEEIGNSATSLATLDTNGDGSITREELRPPSPEGSKSPAGGDKQGPPPGARQAPPIIAALDTNRDQSISESEVNAAPETLKSLDQDNDGELTLQELQPKGSRPPHEGGNMGAGPRPNGPPRGNRASSAAE